MKLKIEKDGIELHDNNATQQLNEELGKIHQLVETHSGPINQPAALVINFNGANAQVTEYDEQSGRLRINLPSYELNAQDGDQLYQLKLGLSHEYVHTITPESDAAKATVLEEGLAVLISEKYTGASSTPPANYAQARDNVSHLLQYNENAIKELREKNPNSHISDYTIDMIREVAPEASDELLSNLTGKFYQ